VPHACQLFLSAFPAFPNDGARDDLRDEEHNDKLGQICAKERRNDEA